MGVTLETQCPKVKVKDALASPEVRSNLGPVLFPGVSDHDRMDLYRTILWMLAVVCVIPS